MRIRTPYTSHHWPSSLSCSRSVYLEQFCGFPNGDQFKHGSALLRRRGLFRVSWGSQPWKLLPLRNQVGPGVTPPATSTVGDCQQVAAMPIGTNWGPVGPFDQTAPDGAFDGELAGLVGRELDGHGLARRMDGRPNDAQQKAAQRWVWRGAHHR